MAALILDPDYPTARAGFLAAAHQAGASVTSHPHPMRGPAGEELAVDVAWLGPRDARHVILVVSATHGVEGYCGSALQRHWLTHHAPDRPDPVAVVLVHGFNPYGFAWVRRVNEDNVDLNRNFVDWSAPVPETPDYDRIADLLVPAAWDEAAQQASLAGLMEVMAEVGLPRLQAIISGGQYHHPTGVFYGGNGPVWSHRWLRAWAPEALGQASQVTIVDLHTGLGPWGHGELIGSHPGDTDGHRRAVDLLGDVRSMVDGDSVSAALTGDWLAAGEDLLPHAEVVAVALEFGTVDPITVLQALRADAWLHAHGDPHGPEATSIRAQVRAAFADDDPAWIATVWDRFAEVMDLAVART